MAIAIKNRDVSKMDWDNLLEEIEDMGASQKRALRSYLNRLNGASSSLKSIIAIARPPFGKKIY